MDFDLEFFMLVMAFFFVTIVGLGHLFYSNHLRYIYHSQIINEINLWRSRKAAGGHGILYDRRTNSVTQAVDKKECEKREKQLIERSGSIFKIFGLIYYARLIIYSFIISSVLSFIITIFVELT